MLNTVKRNVELLYRGPLDIQEHEVEEQISKAFHPVLFTLILLIGCLVVTVFIRYRLIFIANSDIGGIESNIIYSIQRYMAGYALYANPEVPPYSITQYSPFYYQVIAAIGKWINVNPDNTLGIYRVSRFVSLIANSLYALLLFAFSYRFYPNRKVCLAIAITAFVLLPPQAYSRPDSIYIVLVIATFYTCLRAIQTNQKDKQNRWLLLAICCSALAIATKQSGIILPLLLTSYFAFVHGQWLKAIIIGASIGLLSICFLFGLMPEHNLLLLYVNIVKGVNQGLDWPAFKLNIIDHFFKTFSLHNSIGLPLCIWLMRQPKSSHRWLGWFVLILFWFSLLISLKSGSALNYFTEYVALTGVMAAIWLKQQASRIHKSSRNWSLLILSVVFWAVVPNMPNFNWALALRSDALSESPYYQQKKVADYLKDSLKLKPSESVFVTNNNYCYLNGLLYRNCLMPQQEIVAIMYPHKKLDYSAFDQQINKRSIRFLITRPNETTTVFGQLTTASYQLKRRFPEFDVYESL